jgi:hypothetical protein
MKKAFTLAIALNIGVTSIFAQLYVERTPLDSLKILPHIGVTLHTSYWQDEQTVKDYSVDIGKRGKMKLRTALGEIVNVESLVGLLNTLEENGWVVQHVSFIAFNVVTSHNDNYTSELLYTIILKKK